MANPLALRDTPFKLSRPNLPARSNLSEPDPYAKEAIDGLASALGARIWPAPPPGVDGGYADSAQKGTENKGQSRKAAGSTPAERSAPWPKVKSLLAKDLDKLVKEPSGASKLTLETVLAKDSQTSLLYEVRERLDPRGLSYNARTLLRHEALFHYLFAVARYSMGLQDPAAIASYIRDEDEGGGVRRLYEHVALRAANTYVDREKIEVDDRAAFLKAIGPEIKDGAFSFETGVFEERLKRQVQSYAFNRGTLGKIKVAADGLGLELTSTERDFLVSYFDQSRIDLTKETAPYLVSIALNQHRNASLNYLMADTTPSGALDFSVTYHVEDHDSLAINANNVLCAAQLFYVMTLGDELGVFAAADLLVTQYLSRGMVDVQSPQLLQDLQNYVLNEEFPDLKTGRMYKRTSAEERRMFYRQVFNYGDSTLMDGMISNPDFESLWNVLMIETVKFIEKVEHSERPESFVSRGPIAQAIEDIQYNLSTHSSGMAKVLAPVMYKELDFLIERIFRNTEIVSQLALHNSKSYWKVIERVLQEHYQQGVNITALQKKATYGHQILDAVAKYTATMVDDDQAFSSFVSLVEAFIITGEQLEAQPVGLFDGVEAEPGLAPSNGSPMGDDWNF